MSYIFNHWEPQTMVDPTTPIKAFSACSIAELKQIADAGVAGQYVSAGIWTIGDINTNVNYGSQTGGIQLVHRLTDTQRGSSYYNTDGTVVLQFVNTVATSNYMASSASQKYFDSALHTTCNSTIYSGLDSVFKALLKTWTCYAGKENTTTSAGSYGVYSQSVYLAAPTAKEVGSSNAYNSDEDNATFCFDYYSDSSTSQTRRKKTGVYYSSYDGYWWLRSPSVGNTSGGQYWAYLVINNGAIYYNYIAGFVGNTQSVSPIMVI